MKLVSFFIIRLSLIILLVGVVSCSLIRKKQPDYLKAETIPAVKVPEGLDDRRLGQLYRLPKEKFIEPTEFKAPLPPASAVQASSQLASLQQLDNKLWVLNDRDVATSWIQIIDFWRQRKVGLAQTDIAQATLETQWFTEALQPGFSIRYRLRLEHGFQDNTAEIYLSNQKRDNDNLEGEWIATDIDKSVGDDLIHAKLIASSLVSQLINGQTDVGNSFLAESISLPKKSALTVDNNEPVLRLDDDIARVYSALSTALSSEGFLTYATDTAEGLFHFDKYEVVTKKTRYLGLLKSKTISKEEAIPKKRSRHALQKIITHLPNKPYVEDLFFEGKADEREKQSRLSNVPGFLLVVKRRDNSKFVYVRDGYGKVLKIAEAKEILDSIRVRLL